MRYKSPALQRWWISGLHEEIEHIEKDIHFFSSLARRRIAVSEVNGKANTILRDLRVRSDYLKRSLMEGDYI